MRSIRVRGTRHAQIDQEKLALAFLLMAQRLLKDREAADTQGAEQEDERPDREAA